MGVTSCPIAAAIIGNIDHECEHDGCGKSMPLSELATHQESCPFRAKISDLDQPMTTESLEEQESDQSTDDDEDLYGADEEDLKQLAKYKEQSITDGNASLKTKDQAVPNKLSKEPQKEMMRETATQLKMDSQQLLKIKSKQVEVSIELMKKKIESYRKKYNDLMKILIDNVKCQDCQMIPNINKVKKLPVCSNGHMVCTKCVKDTCSTCGVGMGMTFSLLVADVIDNIELTCDKDGCDQKMSLAQMATHKVLI